MDEIQNPVSGDAAYLGLAQLIAENNPYAIPSNVVMPQLTGSLEAVLANKVEISGWLRDRMAKPGGVGDFVDSEENLTQVCNDQMTIADKQQTYYWTVLVPTDTAVPPCPHGCQDRNIVSANPNGAEMKTYQVCKAIFVPLHYTQTGGNGPGGAAQTLEGGILIGYVGSGGH